MIKQIRILLYIFWIYFTIRRTMGFTDYSLESIKITNDTSTSPLNNNIIKLNHTRNTYPKVFWEADLVDNLENYETEFLMFHSPSGNDLYRLMPYRIYRQPICDVLDNVYRKKLMEDAKLYSNMPYSTDKHVHLCDLMPMGHYYIRNYSIDPSIFPKSLDPGRYRLEFLLYKKKETDIVNGLTVIQLLT